MLWPQSPSPGSSSNSSASSQRDEPSLASFIDSIHPVTASAITAVTLLATIYLHKNYIRRFPTAPHIPLSRYRTRRSLFGTVTSVGDGDNIRVYHTPGGRWLGWGWARKIPVTRGELKDQTVHIRLAGVDAPEAAHWGKPAQPYSAEALAWLRAYTLNHRVRVYIYRQDRYERAVGTVYIRKGLWRKDVGLQMLKAGMATVYEAKTDAEFGSDNIRLKYLEAERIAKHQRLGIWGLKKGFFISPYEFKKEARASGAEL